MARDLTLKTARLGPLVVRLLETEDTAVDALTVVLCHGYGAPGTDLCGIGAEVVRARPELAGRVRFAFPEAPLALDFGGRAWWHIDLGRFERAITTGQIDELLDDTPEGMAAARKALRASLEALCAQTKTPWSRVIVGGFSQGAMITTDLALRLEEAPAALAVFSGTLLCRPEWTRLAPARAGLEVLQSHGTHDPLLPFAAAELLRELLTTSGLRVDFRTFPGGHGIDGDVIDAFAALVARHAPGGPP